MQFGFNLLARARRLGLPWRTAAVLLTLQCSAILFEGLGVGLLVPVFQFMQSHGDLAALEASGRHWRVLIDLFRQVGAVPGLGALLLISFVAIALRQALTYLRQSYKASTQLRAVHVLRARIFKRLLNSRTAYHDEATAGSIVNDLTTEIYQATNLLFTVVGIIGSILLILFYLVAMMVLAPSLTLVTLVIIGLSAALLGPFFRRTRALSRSLTAANEAFSTFLVERLRSLRLVRLAGMERAEITNLSSLSDSQRDRQLRLKLLGARVGALIEPLAIGMGLGLVYIGYTVFGLSVELLGLFLFAIVRILPMAKEVMTDMHTAVGQGASLDVVERRLADLERAREPKGGQRIFDGPERALVLERVTYSYPQNDLRALDNVSLRIPAGGMTAIVGPSGSGKSTLIDLIPRLRDPISGHILIDDTPLEEFSVTSLRDGISFVPQNPLLFNVTVAEHIRYGRPDASDDEVFAAAELAGVTRFIDRLPKGYDTICGEVGVMLSAGQRQRVDLARALLRRGRILILDEPTSALDPESEQAFSDALRRLHGREDLTIMIVAHRLNTVMHADLIAVLDQGRLIESGTHRELVRRGGWYASTFNPEAGRSQLAAVGG